MGSNTSTTFSEAGTGSSSNSSSLQNLLNHHRKSSSSLPQYEGNHLKRQSSYKSKSPDNGEEDIEREGSILVDKQPTIVGFVGELIGTATNNKKSNQSKKDKTIAPSSENLADDEIKPIYSATSFTKGSASERARNKSNSSSFRESLTSSTSSSSSTLSSSNSSTTISSSTYPISDTKSFKIARMNSLRGNIILNNTPQSGNNYQAWNTDTICWEEYKRRTIAQQQNQKRRNEATSLSMSTPATTTTYNISSQEQQLMRNSPQRTIPVKRGVNNNTSISNTSPMTFKRQAMQVTTITNRVGMEVESSPLSNFLKNLSAAPSVVTTSSAAMNNR